MYTGIYIFSEILYYLYLSYLYIYIFIFQQYFFYLLYFSNKSYAILNSTNTAMLTCMLVVGWWSSLASSADGTKLVAYSTDMLWFSNNSGRVWTPSSDNTGLPDFGSVSCNNIQVGEAYKGKVVSSADGSMLALSLCHGGVFTSNNGGASWTKKSNGLPKVNVSSNNAVFYLFSMYQGEPTYSSIAITPDGTKLAVAMFYDQALDSFVDSKQSKAISGIYTSTDKGVSWTHPEGAGLPKDADLYGLTMSSDGRKLAVIDKIRGVYTSTDSAASWTQRTSNLPNVTNIIFVQYHYDAFSSIAASLDGTRLVVSVVYTGIYISTDSGATWTCSRPEKLPSFGYNYPSAISMSGDGSRIAIVNKDVGGILVSNTGGSSWLNQTSSVPFNRWPCGYNTKFEQCDKWVTGTISSDGKKIFAGLNGGNIYVSSDSGTSWTAGGI